MLRMNTGVLIGLWAATAVAAFAVGRITTPPEAASAPEDIAASVRSALSHAGALEGFGRTASLLQHLDPETLPEVLAVYDQMLSILDECDIRPFVDAWARFDSAAALDHTLAWPFKIKQEIGAQAAIRSWALHDPLEAQLAFAQTIKENRTLDQEELFRNLLIGWVHSGQGGLDTYLAGLPPGAQDKATIVVAGNLMRKGGAEAAMRWTESILRNEAYDRRFKRSALRRGARSVARWYPERAAAWVMEYAGSEHEAEGVRIVADQWADRDGRAAMQWLHDQPAGESLDAAVGSAFARWRKSDPEGAEEWLDSEPLTAFHDPAIDIYARFLDDRAPREAVGWCERILDPERRLACLETTATRWYRRDAEAAEAWLQKSPLDEEARRKVRTPSPRRRRAAGAARSRANDVPR